MSAFGANRPVKWHVISTSGDADFGVDYLVSVEQSDVTQIGAHVHLQLKGTTQADSKSSKGDFISQDIRRGTVDTWYKSCGPVFLAIADLIDDRNPLVAPVCYQFLSPDLDEIVPALRESQASVTFRVPTSQKIHRDLDVWPFLGPYLARLEELKKDNKIRESAAGVASGRRHGAGAVVSASATAVSGAPPSSGDIELLVRGLPNERELVAALSATKAGEHQRAATLVQAIAAGNSVQTAIKSFILGRAAQGLARHKEAERYFRRALTLLPQNDQVRAAEAEARILNIPVGAEGCLKRERLIAELSRYKTPTVAAVRAKLLAANGDYSGARAVLNRLPQEKAATTWPIVSILEQDWARAVEEARKGYEVPGLSDAQRLWLDALEARGHFQLALSGTRSSTADYVPFSGLPGMNLDELRLAWASSLRGMQSARRLRWPTNIEYLLDVFCIAATVLGKMQEAFPYLVDAALERPNIGMARDLALKFAVMLDRFDIALPLLDKGQIEARDIEGRSIAIVALLHSGQVARATKLADPRFFKAKANTEAYRVALMALGDAASANVDPALLARVHKAMAGVTDGPAYRAILDTVSTVKESPLRREEALTRLIHTWRAMGRPHVISLSLIDNLSATKQAGVIVEAYETLRGAVELSAEQTGAVATALLNASRAHEAVQILEGATSRFETEPELRCLFGVALDRDGQAARALTVLRQAMEAGNRSKVASDAFVQICCRLGYFEMAQAQLRNALVGESKVENRKALLRMLFGVLTYQGGRLAEAEGVAWSFGALADRDSEEDEGIFLQMYTMATLPAAAKLDPARVAEVKQRLSAYLERFPRSLYLRRAVLPSADAPPGALRAAIQEAAGISEEALEREEAIERKLNSGALIVPFTWRPKRLLRQIPELLLLWEMRKAEPIEKRAFHFSTYATDYVGAKSPDIKRCEPVLSLVSLLLLDELGLLPLVLETFSKLVVGRETLIALQEARNPLSGFGAERAERIVSQIQTVLHKVIHPPLREWSTKGGIPEHFFEDRAAVRLPGRAYFCDDIVEARVVCTDDTGSDAAPFITTVDFLEWADGARLVTAERAAEILGRLCQLKVGITVKDRYLLAAIPASLQHATSHSDAWRALIAWTPLASILDGIWDPTKSFEVIAAHFSNQMAYLIEDGGASDYVLVALWTRWMQSVRLQQKPNLSVIQKMAVAFLFISARFRERDIKSIQRLWSALWTALDRVVGSTLREPADRVGIREVAQFFGRQIAKEQSQSRELVTFVRSGLKDATEETELFDRVLTEAGAESSKSKEQPKS